MRFAYDTNVGKVRQVNQDRVCVLKNSDDELFAVVCDGMGGTNGGNLASSTAVKIISERISSSYRQGMSFSSIKNMFMSAIIAANVSVYDMSKENPELSGMGTTVVVAIVANERVYVAHAGDSRAYILTSGKLHQLTKDHSFVQEMVDSGKLTADEAREDPRKNLITRALGVSEDLQIDFCEEDISENDVLLICTDGLTNYVEPEEIYELTEDGKFYEFAERLVNRANNNGGGDNITVVTVSY